MTCSNLPVLENGSTVYSSGIVNKRPVGSRGNYSCNTGHLLIGNISRTCQNDGNWSGSSPACEGNI